MKMLSKGFLLRARIWLLMARVWNLPLDLALRWMFRGGRSDPISLEVAGIHVVCEEDSDSGKIDQDVSKALIHLHLFHPRRFERVKKYIRMILVFKNGLSEAYLIWSRISIINLSKIPFECPKERWPRLIAGKLLQQATFTLLCQKGLPYCGKSAERIDRICVREAEAVVKVKGHNECERV